MKKVITGFVFSLLTTLKICACEFEPNLTISGTDTPEVLPTFLFYLNPEICATNNGHRMAIWERSRGAYYGANFETIESLLQYSFFDPITNTWTPVSNPAPGTGYIDPSFPPTPIPPPPPVPGIIQQQAEHCCYPNGNTHVIWYQNIVNPISGSGPGILTSLYTVGSGWSPPFTLNTSGASSRSPDIACFESGEAVAIWVSNANTVEFSYYNGIFWSFPPVAIDSGGIYGNLRICANGPNSAIATWVDTSGLVNSILSSTFTIPGSWSIPQVISGTFNIDPGIQVDLGCDPITGNGLVSWAHYITFPLNPQAFGSNYYNGASGTWASAQEIVNPANYIAIPFVSFGPGFSLPRGVKSVCVGGDGNGKLVFRAFDIQDPNNFFPVILALSHDGQSGAYSSPIVLHSGIQDSGHNSPDVCCTACGDASAIWAYATNPVGPSDVMFTSFSAQNGQWSPLPPASPFVLDNVTTPLFLVDTGEILRPTLACNNSGNVFPIWNTVQVSPTVTAPSIKSTGGFCGTYLMPGSLEVESMKKRFPFQSECYCTLRWRVFDCLQGIVGIRIYANGNLVQTVPGTVTHVALPGKCGKGTEFRIEPVNVLGLSIESQTVIVP